MKGYPNWCCRSQISRSSCYGPLSLKTLPLDSGMFRAVSSPVNRINLKSINCYNSRGAVLRVSSSVGGSNWQRPSTLSDLGCEEYRCLLTTNRSVTPTILLNYNTSLRSLVHLSSFDAVLFHERNIQLTDLPRKDQRRPEQLFVHYNLESPVWTKMNLSGELLETDRGVSFQDNSSSGSRDLQGFLQHFHFLPRRC